MTPPDFHNALFDVVNHEVNMANHVANHASHAFEYTRWIHSRLTWTHASFFVEAPALNIEASSHLGHILDYVEECLLRVLLRQEHEVTSTDFVIKSLTDNVAMVHMVKIHSYLGLGPPRKRPLPSGFCLLSSPS